MENLPAEIGELSIVIVLNMLRATDGNIEMLLDT